MFVFAHLMIVAWYNTCPSSTSCEIGTAFSTAMAPFMEAFINRIDLQICQYFSQTHDTTTIISEGETEAQSSAKLFKKKKSKRLMSLCLRIS